MDELSQHIRHYLTIKNFETCRNLFLKFEFLDIPAHAYVLSNDYIKAVGKRVVASFDPKREPSSDEIIIVYGNYPDWHHALACTHKIFRNVCMFFDIKHDVVESHVCWDGIDIIYILNIETRPDRLNDVMMSLVRVKAPLHKIKIIKGIVNSSISPHAACTEGHVNIIKNFKDSGLNRCMILEDDIVFIDDVETVWRGIESLFKHPLKYNVCFLALSKFGARKPLDEVLSITNQPCTTASAYILIKETVDVVFNHVNEGLQNMKRTGDFHNNCIDRYWSSLNNMVYIKKKIAFQRPSWSTTRNSVLFFLD